MFCLTSAETGPANPCPPCAPPARPLAQGAVQSVAQDLATGDVFYPDNSNRQARLEQLEADIHRLVNETAQS